MNLAFVIFSLAFVLAFISIKMLKPMAYIVDLVDKPGGRKDHEGLIPLVGGLGIYVSVCITTFLFIEQPLFIRFFLLAGGMIVFMGMVDDRYQLSARFRLAGQFLVSCIFVYGLDVHIHSFGNLLGLGEIKTGFLGYPFAILSLMGVINALNMLDGMDGLVGSISVAAFIGLIGLFGINGTVTLQLLCLAFVGSICAFLIFNLWGRPNKKLKKIFMGDAGSMFLGLSLGVLLIVGAQPGVNAFSPLTALWFVLLPMTDMFTIMYRRLRRGRSPMAPDRTHVHHIFLRAGFGRVTTLCFMLIIQAFLCAMGVAITVYAIPEYLSFILMILVVLAYQLLMMRCWKFIRWSKRRFA